MNKKIFFSTLGGLISAGSLGGAIAFAFVWKKDYKKPQTNTKKQPEVFSDANVEKKFYKNYPQTIAELKKKYPIYYASLDVSLSKEPLFDALNNVQKKYRTKIGSYGDLWKTYQVAFKDQYDENDNTVYDIYSEKVGTNDDFSFNMPQDQTGGGGYRNPGDSYNREHLIPQSIFKKISPIRNDAHFVFPTDAKINGLRNNYVHDKVINPSKEGNNYGGNNWKLGVGKNTNGAFAFEPDDNFKGDIARSYFYFMLTWHNASNRNTWKPYLPFANNFPHFKTNFLEEYINWSKSDPVDEFDFNRNNIIAKEQGKLRNPFIDMPKLINLIWAS